jgi:hypothetical protein
MICENVLVADLPWFLIAIMQIHKTIYSFVIE